jgi:hypothetical protein
VRGPAFLALLAVLAAAPALAAPDRAEIRFLPGAGRIEATAALDAAGGLAFRLAPGLEVADARLDGRPVTLERAGGLWRLPAGTSGRVLELRYAGPVAGDALLDAEGGFLPSGTGWLPERDGPTAEGLELVLEAPEPYAAVATGRLVEESRDGGSYRARFAAEPTDEGVSAFVGAWRTHERRAGPVALRTYFPPEQAGLSDRYLANAADYLAMLEARIGPYPYAGFAVVSGPLPVGLGFPGIAYVSRRILPLPFMQTTSLAHELLHGWWGNAVGVDYRTGNWAEGLTAYMADYALAERDGAEKARAQRLAWLMDYAALPPERDVALRQFVTKEHDASQVVGYGKAAFVFHMLRQRLGDAAFDRAIQAFYAAERGKRAGWDDLGRAFSAAAGRPLAGFLAPWLDRPGAPSLSLGPTELHRTEDGWALDLRLRQAEPAYPLAVPIAVETDRGTARRTVALDGSETTTTLELPGRPLRVAADPDYDLFRRLAPGEAPPIFRDVTLSGRTAVLVAASDAATEALARELAASLLDQPAAEGAPSAEAPVLVVGVGPALAARLAEAGLPPAPAEVRGQGTARAWIARREGAPPVLAVEAEDAEALRVLLRPLPHYRRDGWLVFEGGRVVARGSWPPGPSPLARDLATADARD